MANGSCGEPHGIGWIINHFPRPQGQTTERSCDLVSTWRPNNGRYADKELEDKENNRRPSAKDCPEVGIFSNCITLDTGGRIRLDN
ncbi:hypothetical protein BDDG_11637 [Blastomyces dermatitidis ATCC 18188]|uniref:Uncharacterized protein n=1 Tax=Ajellomyces dermatitidis (strain ATCC 18188 / CBS 674.68) TaxID=653446 RepID=A0A0J9HCB2_AJEDA|nr:hypothetical protein BDDG_11637 [Blastomyces dermatitidis ATCC 18188]